MLQVARLRKIFRAGPFWRRRTVEVLRDASLTVGTGEIVSLVGENGSGKSTLMQTVVGLWGRPLTVEAGTPVLAPIPESGPKPALRQPAGRAPRRRRVR